jgi:phosphatidyl-myo-inositol alpha-mannosyltransferase
MSFKLSAISPLPQIYEERYTSLMPSLRIGLVIPYSYSHPGGVQIHTLSLGKYLTILGHKVIYFSPTQNQKDCPKSHITIGNGLLLPSPNGSRAPITFCHQTITELKTVIDKQSLDILHLQEIIAPTVSWKLLHASSCKNVATYHAGWDRTSYLESIHPLLKQIAPNLIPFLHASITVSPIAKRCYQELLIHPNYMISPAIDLMPLTQTYARPTKLPKDKVNLLFISRFDPRKGLPHLIKALATLNPATLSSIHLSIIGDGPQRQQVVKLIEQYNLSPYITFLGVQTSAIKYQYLKHADIFIAPTTHGESFGMILTEAMAAGLPIIAGNNEAYRYVLKKYPTSKALIDPKNAVQFASSIEYYCNHPQLRRMLSSRGKVQVKQYSALTVAKKHIDIYTRILQQNPPLKLNKSTYKKRIAYYECGSNKNPTLIVLHGHRSSALRLKPIILELAYKYHVIAPDLPGFGYSPPLKRCHSMENISQRISAWLDSFPEKKYYLMGFSMGGIIAIKTLKHLKNKPRKLMLYGVPFKSEYLTLNSRQQLGKTLTSFLSSNSQITLSSFEGIINSDNIMKLLYKFFMPQIGDLKTLTYEIQQWRSQSARVFIETTQDLLATDLSNEPPSDIPNIYASSSSDDYIDTNAQVHLIRHLLPNTQFIHIPLQQHVPKGEFPQKLSKKIVSSFSHYLG